MTIKELKKKIQNLPDDAEVVIDFGYFDGTTPGWESWNTEDGKEIKHSYFEDWKAINAISEFHLSTYKEN